MAAWTYDALGRMIRYEEWDPPGTGAATSVVHYYHDGANVVAEYDGTAGNLWRYYVHGSNGIDERAVMYDRTSGQDHYYALRELDTVVGLIGERGNWEEGYTYDAYGVMRGWSYKTGDFNANGSVDLIDMTIFNSAFGSSPRPIWLL